MITRTLLFGVAILCACLLACGSGCNVGLPSNSTEKSDDSGASAGQEDAGGVPADAENQDLSKIVYLELLEVNRDSFPKALVDYHENSGPPPVSIANSQLILHEPDEQDSFEVGPPPAAIEILEKEAALADCRFVVVYRTQFVGQGRNNEYARYFAFAAPPATISLTAPFEGNRFEYDPTSDLPPFEYAIERLRGFSGDAPEVIFSEDEDKNPTAALFGESHPLESGIPVKLAEAERKIEVVELPLKASAIEFDDDIAAEEVPDDLPEFITERHDYGAIVFTTEVFVTYHGNFPARIVHEQPHADANADDGDVDAAAVEQDKTDP